MEWSTRRKIMIIVTVSTVVLGTLFFLFKDSILREPSCFDGRKNGEEGGVDCGGRCALYCPETQLPVRVRWSRSFPIAKGVVHAVAYIEHTNNNAGSRVVPYEFTLLDANNVIILKKQGSTMLGVSGKTAIVETLIETPIIPTTTTFTFLQTPVWERIDPELSLLRIKTDRYTIESFSLGTRLSMVLENESLVSLKDLEVVVIVYGDNDTAQTVTSVRVPELLAESKKTVFATWPFRFKEEVSRVEIIPRIHPFPSPTL